MKVLGCDFSTRYIDLVTLPLEGTGEPQWTRVELERGGAFKATRSLRKSLGQRALLGGYFDDIAVAYLERPYGRGQAIHALMRVQGALLACIPTRVVVDEFAPAEWRQLVGLPGNAKKDHVRAFVWAREPEQELWPQDACDAYCIAVAGRTICEKGVAA